MTDVLECQFSPKTREAMEEAYQSISHAAVGTDVYAVVNWLEHHLQERPDLSRGEVTDDLAKRYLAASIFIGDARGDPIEVSNLAAAVNHESLPSLRDKNRAGVVFDSDDAHRYRQNRLAARILQGASNQLVQSAVGYLSSLSI